MPFEFNPENPNNTGYPATAYGPAFDKAKYGGVAGTGSGQVEEFMASWVVDLADPAGAADADFVQTLPANVAIKSCDVQITETVSGGISFNVGLVEPDGTVIDPDGLVVASTSTLVGEYVVGAGALIEKSVDVASQLEVSGDRTAGKIKIKVEYLQL